MAKRYIVTLTDEERASLQERIHKGKGGVRKVQRGHILLLADEGESDEAIAEVLHISQAPIQRTRRRFVAEGLEEAFTERRRLGQPRKWTGRQETFWVA